MSTEVMPFLFYVPAADFVTGQNNPEGKDYWIVKVAQFDYTWANVAWMGDDSLPPDRTLVPDVDLTKEVHKFDSEEKAQEFIRKWWRTH